MMQDIALSFTHTELHVHLSLPVKSKLRSLSVEYVLMHNCCIKLEVSVISSFKQEVTNKKSGSHDV